MAKEEVRYAAPARSDPWRELSRHTPARIALGRAGASLPTAAMLELQLAHARARDAVHRQIDAAAVEAALLARGWATLRLHSAAGDRAAYIRRPDLGRILSDDSKAMLEARPSSPEPFDAVFVFADGLSAAAVEKHAVPLLDELQPRLASDSYSIAPICIVEQARVAIGDEIGAMLPARMSVTLIGERPGLSSPDSLGIYLTWEPLPGRSNAQRNCISNVRPEGLGYALAAHKLYHLMLAARSRQLSGVALKDEAPALRPPGDSPPRIDT